jgi:hypothetical protein
MRGTRRDGASTQPVPRRRNTLPGRLLATLAACASAATLIGCSSMGGPAEGIGYRQARFEKMEARRAYETCVEKAYDLDRSARESASPAQYLASARLIDRCESELDAGVVGLEDQRMTAYALSIQNYLKAGEVARARNHLDHFRAAFPNRDLYFADGTSFIDTMSVLLGTTSTSPAALATLNINAGLRDDIKRAHYWKRN